MRPLVLIVRIMPKPRSRKPIEIPSLSPDPRGTRLIAARQQTGSSAHQPERGDARPRDSKPPGGTLILLRRDVHLRGIAA